MKMILAGTGSPSATDYLFNCTHSVCQRPYYVPIKNFSDIILYFDLPVLASGMILTIHRCDGTEIPFPLCSFVIGQKPDLGFYGVAVGENGGEAGTTIFYISAVIGGYTFFSQQYIIGDCGKLAKVEACFNDAVPDTFPDQSDCNGAYYGYSIGTVFGNSTLRYQHKLYVRNAKVTPTRRKLSFTYFNNNYTYKSSMTKQSQFVFELVPTFYADELIALFMRGNIKIDDVDYKVDDQDFALPNQDNELWKLDLLLKDSCGQYFNCTGVPCALPDCGSVTPPPPECCEPTGVSVSSSSAGTELVGQISMVCSDDGCTVQGNVNMHIHFNSPTPEAIELLFGEVYLGNSGTVLYRRGTQIMSVIPPGTVIDPYYDDPTLPFQVIVPAGTTDIDFPEPIQQKGHYPAPVAPEVNFWSWICHSCLNPTQDIWVKSPLGYISNFTLLNEGITLHNESFEVGNQITVSWTPCVGAVSYNIHYRPLGSTGGYRNAGNFTTSPAIFTDNSDPSGTLYEGLIRAIDASGNLCTEVPFASDSATINWSYSNFVGLGGVFRILVNGSLVVFTSEDGTGSLIAPIGAEIVVVCQTTIIGQAQVEINSVSTSQDHINEQTFIIGAGTTTIMGASFGAAPSP